MRNFTTIMAPRSECLKEGKFQGNESIEASFKVIKAKLSQAPFLVLPNYSKTFDLQCDDSGVGIGTFSISRTKTHLFL